MTGVLPVPTITLFLDLPFDSGDFFTIGHPTKGAIQGAYGLAGDLGSTDITASSYAINIRRGRNSQLDQTDIGTASVSFRNYDRAWDPLNTASPNYGALSPGKQVQIDIYGQRIFTGYVDDWFNTYTVMGEAVGSFPCIDGLGILGRQAFDAWTTTASQTAGLRIEDVLDRGEVGWPGGARDLDAGATVLQADSVTWGSNPLNYLQLVAETDQGTVFVDRNGVMCYRDRLSFADPTPTVSFADDGSAFPFAGAELTGAGERFFTQVSVDREGGIVQTASRDDVGSSSAIRRLPISGLLMDTDIAAMDLAEWLLSLYAEPIPRVKTITVNLGALTDDAERAQVVALDVGHVINVLWTPLGVGSTIVEDYSIEGLEHDIPYTGPHMATFNLAPITQRSLFTIEDPILGALGGPGRIAF